VRIAALLLALALEPAPLIEPAQVASLSTRDPLASRTLAAQPLLAREHEGSGRGFEGRRPRAKTTISLGELGPSAMCVGSELCGASPTRRLQAVRGSLLGRARSMSLPAIRAQAR
jgi:hypothetical protein